MPTDQQIFLAAAAIANARGGRRGAPAISNIMDILPENLKAEVLEDAKVALEAAIPKDLEQLQNLLLVDPSKPHGALLHIASDLGNLGFATYTFEVASEDGKNRWRHCITTEEV